MNTNYVGWWLSIWDMCRQAKRGAYHCLNNEHGLIASFISHSLSPLCMWGRMILSFYTFQWIEKSGVKPSMKAGLCFRQTTPKCQNILGAVFRDLEIRLDRFLLNKFPSVDSEAHSYSAGSKECAQHLKISQSYRNKKSIAKYWQQQRAIDHYFVEHN